ncbi:MAG: anti-sigma factor [Rudaea sp.]
MSTRPSDIAGEPPEGALTSAEYVLGVLDAAARRSAAARIDREPAFAAEVVDWERRLAPLIDEIVPVPVPFALWPRIQGALGMAPPPRRGESSPWQSVGLWRWLSAGGFAAAAASLFALFIATRAPEPTVVPPPPAAHELVAKMTQDDGKALFVVTIDANTGKLVIQPLDVNIPANRVAELWIIPAGDVPHSLGLVDPQHPRPISIPAALQGALKAKSLVAVSLEPPGGAPHGAPTGPIIAKGEIALL